MRIMLTWLIEHGDLLTTTPSMLSARLGITPSHSTMKFFVTFSEGKRELRAGLRGSKIILREWIPLDLFN